MIGLSPARRHARSLARTAACLRDRAVRRDGERATGRLCAAGLRGVIGKARRSRWDAEQILIRLGELAAEWEHR